MSKSTTAYYDRTAALYDELHGQENNPEHIVALERGWPLLERLGVSSVLDVGCGTGLAMTWLAQRQPTLRLVGIDPSKGQIDIAKKKLPQARLEVGSGERLPFETRSVDLVLASAVMHHVDRPEVVIKEMFRVAKKAIFISDHNNFSFGGTLARRVRMWLYASGLLGIATFVKQGFRRQGYSEEDGWWYPYSLLNDYGVIASLSAEQYLIPTRPTNANLGNLLLNQSHLAILAVKPQSEWG